MNQIGLLEQQQELQWQSSGRSQAQEVVFPVAAARAQAAQTSVT
jgi:hypothetical protein